ncbi:beta-ketoacyl-[acyl-carrier-protein] synthase family protein [Streptomyces sp. RKAG293]|uniref:beta-ketoacyl-[acyl-carrier-protein] synthase family protein n=1 Tax=Streptomyces sp. RKAG293 TaxID=2893403 RepID=UPI0020334449|nr:beta-ketoacyl-[acyl-carrier-protein] synthase family protein [Streptomyces sp. RKAG293]MCM2416566.1 beta-ketoacyl-[acyl-carrier-protein] synthase family protein [Streptomyces sp. RKAG293]
MNVRTVAVTGLGLVTPAGIGAAATWEHFLGGAPTARPDHLLAGLPVDFSCQVGELNAAARLGGRLSRRLDRFTQMALIAAREAVADAGLDPRAWNADRVGVVLGVSSNGIDTYPMEYARLAKGHPDRISPMMMPRSIPNMVSAEVSLDLGAHGPSLTVNTACASGGTALGVACDLLRSGTCDIVISGGTDSQRNPMTASAFAQLRTLSRRHHDHAGASRPFDADRDGFVLGEGSGILVLERAEHMRARAARPRVYLSGHGASCDVHHYTAPHPKGDGLARAIRTALTGAGLAPEDIDHVNAHATSTVLNDRAEAAALHQVFREPPPVTANKSIIGHSLGAAGAIEAALTALTIQHQLIPPTANLDRIDPDIDLDVVTKTPRSTVIRAALSASSGFGGQNAVIVMTAP